MSTYMQDTKRCRTIEFFNRQIPQHVQLIFIYFFTTVSTFEHKYDATLHIALYHNTVIRKLSVKNQSSQVTDAEIILNSGMTAAREALWAYSAV